MFYHTEREHVMWPDLQHNVSQLPGHTGPRGHTGQPVSTPSRSIGQPHAKLPTDIDWILAHKCYVIPSTMETWILWQINL